MKYITLEERKSIQKMYKEGISCREMGRVLGRSHSTVSAELQKNKMWYEKEYCAEKAHERFLKRQMEKGKKTILEIYPWIKEKIIEWMTNEQWSPEQIAGQLGLMCGERVICHETIYQFVYSEEGRELKLWLHMRHKKKPMRQFRGGRKRRGIQIQYRVPISARPRAANERKEIGHLETDSMIFSDQRPILSVQVDRKAKKCCLTLLPDKTAKETKYALRKAIEEFGERHVKTITYDNGTENAKHHEINEEFGIMSFFCRAYASWQKGLVENTNKLIRQYLPRYTDMAKMTQEMIYEIQEKLNNRPRKSLGFLTPNQAYLIFSQGGRLRT